MAEHITENQFTRYRQSKLSAAELQQIDEHLQQCAVCQARATESRLTAHQIYSLQTEFQEHLRYEDLAAYVDQQLNHADLAKADAHLRLCHSCSLELNDLRAFQQDLRTPPVVTLAAKPRWFQQWRESIRMPWVMPFAAVTVCLLLALVAVPLWRGTKIGAPEKPADLAQTPSLTPASENPVSASAVTISLKDGTSQITLDEQNHLKGLAALSPAQEQLALAALKNGKIALAPPPAELHPRTDDVLLGNAPDQETLKLIAPVRQIVLATRPSFRWQALPNAASYRVTIFSKNYEIVAESPSLTTTTWTPPRALSRNQIYLWQVAALKKDGQEIKAPMAPAPEARFQILKQSLADEITAARGSHLLAGLAYAQAGLYEESESELRKLAQQNPDAPIAQQLLKTLRAQHKKAK